MQVSRVWLACLVALQGVAFAVGCTETEEGGGDGSGGDGAAANGSGASSTGGSAATGGAASATGGQAAATGAAGTGAGGAGAAGTGGGAIVGGDGAGGSTPCDDVNGFVGCCEGDVAKYCDDAGTVHEVPCGGTCGWFEDGYYFCDGQGADPSGTHPLACP